jgi:hypothetical protein
VYPAVLSALGSTENQEDHHSMKRTHGISSLAAITTAALFGFVLLPQQVFAFAGDELACREKIAKDGSKLAANAGKAIEGCHKSRSTGKGVTPATNCNDVAQADSKGTVAKSAQKLVEDANSTCASLTPADLLYTECPSPCDAVVPSITTFQHVADCIVCVVEDHAEQVGFNGQGNPSAPMNSVDSKCHGAIGKGQTKFV